MARMLERTLMERKQNTLFPATFASRRNVVPENSAGNFCPFHFFLQPNWKKSGAKQVRFLGISSYFFFHLVHYFRLLPRTAVPAECDREKLYRRHTLVRLFVSLKNKKSFYDAQIQKKWSEAGTF